ncbi:MAG TPA: hypothetical protein VMW87_01120 [Spirochaetia bacterium]|nr:hypothetical protein [Spirochaetia bacterium]
MGSVETLRYWPKQVSCPEDVPGSFAEELHGEDLSSLRVLYAPQAASPFGPQKEHLLLFRGNELTVHTASRRERSTFVTRLGEVHRLEWGRVLLRSWLAIFAGTSKAMVTFNTVREDLFVPVAAAIRGGSFGDDADEAGSDLTTERAKLDYLASSGYKFMNYGRRSLMRDERILSTLYQETFPLHTIRFGGFRLLTQFATPCLLLLTDRELILIREEQEFTWSRRQNYGCVQTFIPVPLLEESQFGECDSGLELAVRTSAGGEVRARMARDNSQLPAFTASLQGVIRKNRSAR